MPAPSNDRFKQAVIATLAKRAANRCSNPDCSAITSGPADDPTRSVNVGEAAHIFGANPGSARYDATMASTNRCDITNAIWLCGNCHKLIDDDPAKYPSGLLFEWQRDHERRVAESVGKAGAELRDRYERRHLEEFGRLSYLGERLIIEKGEYWEFKLTAEMLRFEITPVLNRWDALGRGLYVKAIQRIELDDTIPWFLNRLSEITHIANGLAEIMNIEFSRGWGEPGVAGNDTIIVSTCRLFAEMCQAALDWEERVRFVAVDDIFQELHQLFCGVAGGLINEAARVPRFLSETTAGEVVPGQYELNVVLSLPDGWETAIATAVQNAKRAMVDKAH